jgi:hypothetical protein
MYLIRPLLSLSISGLAPLIVHFEAIRKRLNSGQRTECRQIFFPIPEKLCDGVEHAQTN